MDKQEYRRKYYKENRAKLQAYQRWYYQKRKKERKNPNEKISDEGKVSIAKPKNVFSKTYGEFIIHFE
jgi:hypothetical protein